MPSARRKVISSDEEEDVLDEGLENSDEENEEVDEESTKVDKKIEPPDDDQASKADLAKLQTAASDWKKCALCKTPSQTIPCKEPCPQPPSLLKIITTKSDSHMKLFEFVCNKGGFARMKQGDWDQIHREIGYSAKACKDFYESSLLRIEKEQTAQLLQSLLSETSMSRRTISNSLREYDEVSPIQKNPLASPNLAELPTASSLDSSVSPVEVGKRRERCRLCIGCLREDCGFCRYCRDKPKFGGKNSLKQACEKKSCTGPSMVLVTDSVKETTSAEPQENNLSQWQRSLLSSAMWGPAFQETINGEASHCGICDADIRLLNRKRKCSDCAWSVACETCVPPQQFWCCRECIRNNAPSMLNLAICTGCGQNFTQTRLGQVCVECTFPFCSVCATTELRRGKESDGAGLRCTQCLIWRSQSTTVGLHVQPKCSKKLRLVAAFL
jgi:hypothetical protein